MKHKGTRMVKDGEDNTTKYTNPRLTIQHMQTVMHSFFKRDFTETNINTRKLNAYNH